MKLNHHNVEIFKQALSVIETCRLRKQDPWIYIAETVAFGRSERNSGLRQVNYPSAEDRGA